MILLGTLLFTEVNVSLSELLLFSKGAARRHNLIFPTIKLWLLVWVCNYIGATLMSLMFVGQGSFDGGCLFFLFSFFFFLFSFF